VLRNLEEEMKKDSKRLEFEEAEKIRHQIFSLKHIQDVALIGENNIAYEQTQAMNNIRIEGYDISNISGTSAVGSMVVFIDGLPEKDQYRKFRIKSIVGSSDVGMLREVLSRRLAHLEWPLPNLFLIDGGLPQVNAVYGILSKAGVKIPVIGIAKGPTRKKNEFIVRHGVSSEIDQKTLIRVRDEAHRFGLMYHRKLRGENFLS
jgi:excinuclease ABC subunit C